MNGRTTTSTEDMMIDDIKIDSIEKFVVTDN